MPEVITGHSLVGPRGGIDQIIRKEGVLLITKAGLPPFGWREQREVEEAEAGGLTLQGWDGLPHRHWPLAGKLAQ